MKKSEIEKALRDLESDVAILLNNLPDPLEQVCLESSTLIRRCFHPKGHSGLHSWQKEYFSWKDKEFWEASP